MGSHLPPQVLNSLARLPEPDRKFRAQELLGKYDARSRKLHKIGDRLRARWIKNQAEFLQSVRDELQLIVDSGDIPDN